MGILAGLCGVTTGMAGPPLILYFAYTKMTPAELRGTSVVFFLISGIISIGFFLFQGAAPEKWMLEAGDYTMKRFAGLYGMTYGGMATNKNDAAKLKKTL